MMIHTPAAVAVPLYMDEYGVIRIGQTRVTLLTILGRYKAGESAETIHESFPTVSLSDIYAVIAYYLANREMVDEYLGQIEVEAERTRQMWEARYTPEQKARREYFRQKVAEKRNQQDS